MPGPAQGITQVWGIPSPIDTVFTRCNCQGKTYIFKVDTGSLKPLFFNVTYFNSCLLACFCFAIFKGSQYWRFQNDVLDPGYPMAVDTGFDGLRGHITAALSVPQYQSRRESVYFFKRGNSVFHIIIIIVIILDDIAFCALLKGMIMK